MPTGIMTTPMQTKKVGNTPSPRNTSFLKIIGFFLLLISLWNYLAHKKLTPPHRAPLSLTELDCILPMECVSLSINLLSLYHHDSSNLSWMKPRMLTWWPLPGTPWRLSYDHPSIFLQHSQLCDHEGELHSVSRLLLCFSLLVQYSTNCMGCSTHYYKIGFVWIIFAHL